MWMMCVIVVLLLLGYVWLMYVVNVVAPVLMCVVDFSAAG